MIVSLGLHPKMDNDLSCLCQIYETLGVEVFRLDSRTTDSVFHRDVAAWTPFGLIKCRMGKASRAWEPDWWFEKLSLEPALAIEAPATFEGADLLWVGPELAVLGVSARTNHVGAGVVKTWLEAKEVKAEVVHLPEWHDQHLHGLANVLALKPFHRLGRLFACESFREELSKVCESQVLPLPQAEYAQKAPNWVQVGGQIVISQSCPYTKKLLQKWIKTIVCPVEELLACGGGIACATGIISYV